MFRSFIAKWFFKLTRVEQNGIGGLGWEEYFMVYNDKLKDFFFSTGNCPICGYNDWKVTPEANSQNFHCNRCEDFGRHIEFNAVAPHYFEYIPRNK